jgi:spore coat protein JC
MWIYEKRLQYPINIATPNAALAKLIAAQYGGPHLSLLFILFTILKDAHLRGRLFYQIT